jgi:FtsZ-binding cell division protein ZapB
MARRSDLGADSLDLLLDTICNVFGGIILMAILVVLQTQTSAGRIPEPKAQDVQQAIEAQRLRFECDRLEERATNLSQHRDEIARTFYATTSPTGERLADVQGEFKKAIQEAQRRIKAAEPEAASGRKEHAETEDLLRTVERSLKDKQAEVRSLEEELKRSQVSLPRQVRLPHRRGGSVGAARYYVVKGARAYALNPDHRFNWYGGEQRAGHCMMTPVSASDFSIRAAKVVPIDGTGYPVRREPAGADAFMSSLARYPAGAHYIVFFVYNDSESFAAFQTLKDAVAGARYRYMANPVVPEAGAFTVVPVAGHQTE